MPRKIRVAYPGAIYHVLSRGDRREDIFLDDVDRQDYLKTLAEACQKTGFQVHAYCLMHNHFHLVVETPNANLVAGMAWLRSGEHHSGALRQEGAEVKAGRIIEEELRRLGWPESGLAERRKTDPGKLALAARLRRETALPLKWIAARVRLGTSKSANANLHRWMQAHPEPARKPPSATAAKEHGTA